MVPSSLLFINLLFPYYNMLQLLRNRNVLYKLRGQASIKGNNNFIKMK